MKELEQEIKQKEKELEKLRKDRDKAKIENIATIDREIVLKELQIKRLKDSQELLELEGQENVSLDNFARAKLHLTELIDQVREEEIDMNSDEPRLTASARLVKMIGQLELLRIANEPRNLPFSPTRDFTEQFDSCISAKTERINSARETIASKDREIQNTETLLEKAIQEGNSEKIIEYSDLLETARKTREYLEPMLKASEQSETFAPGTITNAWKKICDIYRYEWLLRIEIISTAQDIHLKACNELIELSNYLKSLRSEIQRIGNDNGSSDQIVMYNAQISDSTDLQKIREIKRDQYESLNRYIYYDKSRLL